MNKILKSLLSVRYSTLKDLILKYNHHNQNWFIHLMSEYWAHTLLRQHAEGLGEKSHQDRSVMSSKQYFSLNKGCLFWLARYTSKITNDYSYIFFIVIIIHACYGKIWKQKKRVKKLKNLDNFLLNISILSLNMLF